MNGADGAHVASSIQDVLIIGGGHAGLSAALTTYRALLKTVIFDTNKPRNEWKTPIRLTSTWDGKPPDDHQATCRAELAQTGFVEFIDAEVISIARPGQEGGLFQVADSQGRTWLGRKLLLAVGASNVFPAIEGYQENFAKHIYPCTFQFGFELRGVSSAGLLAVDGLVSPQHAAMLADDGHRLTEEFTIYTNANTALAAQLEAMVGGHGIKVDGRPILRLRAAPSPIEGDKGAEGLVIEFSDGSPSKWEGFLVHRQQTRSDSPLIKQLGLAMSPMGDIDVKMPFCQTNVPGVFAAGDCASMMKIIPHAAAMGAYAGCGIARELPRRVTGNPCT